MRIKYSKELLEPIVKNCISVAGVMRELKLNQSGGNHYYLSKKIAAYEINTDHFLGQGANSGQRHRPEKLSPETILVIDRHNGRKEDIGRLRRALLESGIEHKCAVCGLPPLWCNKYLQLQIDHINGVITDNRIENLRFICGNCHMQTDTFGTKNATHLTKPIVIKPPKLIKTEGPKPSEINPEWRHQPRPNTRKVERPTKEELEQLLWEKPTVQLAIEFCVSDNAVSKWAKSYGLSKPPPGYWAKLRDNQK
jgi:5-methylcytosine-specific restriction endonuclease McrA